MSVEIVRALPIPQKSLVGKRFGRLAVAAFVGRSKTDVVYECRCDCGTKSRVVACNLKNGSVKSCGCLKRDNKAAYKHGSAKNPEWWTWCGMLARCSNPTHRSFPNYGGRGIRVCDRWKASFLDFLADVGPKPSATHSIDRINNDGNYEPGNCRWATATEQVRNNRRFHGHSESPEYFVWCNVKTRCLNPKRNLSGVKMCQRWVESFTEFLKDVGTRPSDSHFLRRIDPKGDWTPDNCRWVIA